MRHLRGRNGRAAIGLVISLVALALVIRSVDLAAAWDALRSAQPQWLALLVLFVGADLLLRAVRWRMLLVPIARLPYRMVLSSLLVGYLANNVLPARLGEIVRSHDLGDRSGVSRSTILGTIVVERVVDTVVVVTIASVAILVLSVRGIVASAVLVGLAVTALLVLLIALGMVAHRLPGADRVGAFIGRWPRVRLALTRLREGLAIVGSGRTMAGAVALSIGSWSFAVLAFAAAAQSVGIQPTLGQAALLAAGVNLATAIPAAPGYVGTFELAAVAIARSVGIDPSSALAFALLVHVTTLAVTSIGGAIAMTTRPHRETVPGAAAPGGDAVPVRTPGPVRATAPAGLPADDFASRGDRS